MKKQNQYFPQSVAHAGETLQEKLAELKMSPHEFSLKTGRTEKEINTILEGKSAIMPDLAIIFENTLQIPARFWLNAQRNFDNTNR
ncbi:HTH-type transcriptional regulator/antitoxin HigA [Arcicella aurantiaca]|uniref:HTH-type transcriptional regulator/antitoxin HigA n=1 Tax=Arcicella aurantiaca TaxID=591202 RepID=A0A316DD11_9BACT|nr:hypothetical protein [Arcicella aurantiaca]PWK16097.1 HTH-type transcriptional regulator/antitoxin HigA [Arcicella aurantiaca]